MTTYYRLGLSEKKKKQNFSFSSFILLGLKSHHYSMKRLEKYISHFFILQLFGFLAAHQIIFTEQQHIKKQMPRHIAVI